MLLTGGTYDVLALINAGQADSVWMGINSMGLAVENSLSRDLKNDQIDPYPLPYSGLQNDRPAGYIQTIFSINRYTSRSCVVFQGVLPGEDPRLSTMWVILGEPVCGIAVPLWILAGTAPPEMNGTITAPVCDASIFKDRDCYPLESSPDYINTFVLDDGIGGGIFRYIFPIEDWVFAQTATKMGDWRGIFPTTVQVKEFEDSLTCQAYACFLAGVAPSETILAPQHLIGQRVTNRSLSQLEHIHILSWLPNSFNENILFYRIYRLEAQSKFLLSEQGAGFLEYWDRGVDLSRHYVYAVTAVNAEGREGNPAVTSLNGILNTGNMWEKLTRAFTSGRFLRKEGP